MSLEQRARETLVRTAVEMADKGFLAGIGGNLALRIDAERFAVTPSASDYYAMSPADICILRLDTLEQLAGDGKPSVESGLHARMFRARPDCQASLHTHQPIASAFTLLGRALPISGAEARRVIGRQVPMCAYGPSGSGLLSWLVSRRVRPDVNAYLMRNHGAIGIASTFEQAGRVMELLELEARDWFRRALLAQPDNALCRDALASLNDN
ncbi:class II aldolase/adducin family protein [Pseudomonas mendocina]|nr:class II aldolase/adducin family protein [Pseudomonas mendocina]MBH3338158.1 class II aldolase/adducin family protein [Pseudomonas mendocina]